MLGDGSFEVRSPRLRQASEELVALGVPLETAVDLLRTLRRHAEAVAKAYASLFVEHVWRPFEEAEGEDADWRGRLRRARAPAAARGAVAAGDLPARDGRHRRADDGPRAGPDRRARKAPRAPPAPLIRPRRPATLSGMDGVATNAPAARAACGPARLLRRRRSGRAGGRARARALRAAGLRAQGDRPQQARRRAARASAARSSSTRRPRSPRARSSSSPPTASLRACTPTPRPAACRRSTRPARSSPRSTSRRASSPPRATRSC